MLALSAAAPGPEPSKIVWRWDQDPGVCTLRQEIAGTGNAVTINRRPTSADTTITLYDVADQVVVSSQKLEAAKIQLSSGETVSGAGYVRPGSKASRRTITIAVADPQFLSKFASTSSLSLSDPSFGHVSVPLRATPAAARALAACEDRKLRSWGISPALLNTLQRRPVPLTPLSSGLRDIYPDAALRLNAQGDLVLLLTVATDGSVQRCAAVEASVYREFYYAACDALKRSAKFQPALDSNGNPIAAPYLIPISFRTVDW